MFAAKLGWRSGLLGCLIHGCGPEEETCMQMGADGCSRGEAKAGGEEQEMGNESRGGGRGEWWREAGLCLWLW